MMALNYVGLTNAISRWSRNQILKVGQLLVRMASTSLPKAVPILPSSNIDHKKKKTSTTVVVTDGTEFSRKDLEEFWYNSEQVWPLIEKG